MISLVKNFLEGGGSVCPFAPACPKIYCEDSGDLCVALEGLASNGALVVVSTDEAFPALRRVAPDRTEFEETTLWANSVFMALYFCCLRLRFPEAPTMNIVHFIQQEVASVLASDQVRPVLNLKEGGPLITFCMAPMYPRSHPRYAPTPIVVVNRLYDANAVGEQPKVRKVMEREHGHVYDAHELVVPLPRRDRGA